MELNETIQPTEGIWLGRLRNANTWFATLQPVAELRKGAWTDIEGREAQFPTQGCVTVKRSDLGQTSAKGSLWIFGCKPSGMDRHLIRAVNPERAIPLIDLSSYSLADAKRKLLEVGVSLPEHHGGQAVVLFDDDRYCTFRFDAHGHLFLGRLPAEGIVEFRTADPTWKTGCTVDKTFFLPMRGSPNGEVVGHADWSSDETFLLKILERYRVAVSAFSGIAEQAPELAITKLHRALSEGRLTDSAASDLGPILDRMRAEWGDISQALLAVEEIGQFLLESAPGKLALDGAVKRRREALIAKMEVEIRGEVELRLSSSHDELSTLANEVQKLTLSRDELMASVSTIKDEKRHADQALQGARTVLDELRTNSEELRGKIEHLLLNRSAIRDEIAEAERCRNALANQVESLKTTVTEFRATAQREFDATGENDDSPLQLLAARLEKQLCADDHPAESLLPEATPPWWRPSSADDALPISTNDLVDRIVNEAGASGIQAEDLHILDLFARSGELVLVVGPYANAALHAYSRVVSGNCIRTHPVDPSTIGLDDLWRIPGSGRPTALAQAWHQAEVQSDKAVLLCLSNLDAAPFHFWLASLVSVLRSHNRPRNLIVVATLADIPQQDENYPGADSLRRHLAALEPQVDSNMQLLDLVFDGQATSPTVLVGPWHSERPPQSAFRTIARSGRDPEAVRRALGLCSVAGRLLAQLSEDLASAWSQYLVDGSLEALPPALSAGHARLKALHFQR